MMSASTAAVNYNHSCDVPLLARLRTSRDVRPSAAVEGIADGRQLPRVPRVLVEVGLLLLDPGLVAAGEDVASDPPHVPAAAAIEDQHAAEQLQHGQKARVGVVRMHASAPLAAEREHLAVEPAHDLVAV